MTDNSSRADVPAVEPGADVMSVTIGVTGHRPTRLRDADLDLLRTRVHDALTVMQTALPAATLTILSPLAEGSDQLVARVALEMGCRLACALPFNRDAYALDFPTAAAKAEYRALLMLAVAVVELDGVRTTPEERDTAYSAVGAYTVAHSDVLLTIWDGLAARGVGGTGQVVDLALDEGVPVIWIPATPPHNPKVLARGTDGSRSESPLSPVSAPMLRPRATR